MSNICLNVLYVTAKKQELLDALKSAVRSEEEAFDFSKIVPIPEERDTNDWRICYWGTKWNAEIVSDWEEIDPADWYRAEDYVSERIVFDTAWSPAIDVIRALSAQHPEVELLIKYEEPGMGFHGWSAYVDGKLKESFYTDQRDPGPGVFLSQPDKFEEELLLTPEERMKEWEQ